MAYETPEARKARRAQVQAENAQIRRERERQQKIEQGKRQGWVNPNLLTQQERLDRQLERAGLLNYQTRGQSQGDIAARFQKEGIRLTPNSSWFQQNYKSNPNSFTAGQPTAQTQQPTTPMQFATPDQVKNGQANWTDISAAERKKILTNPLFYKSEISKYPLWVQPQILAESDFKWDMLPSWQRPYYQISSNPKIMASPMALAGARVGSFLGPVGQIAGAAAGYTFGLVGGQQYNPVGGWKDQPTPAARGMWVLNALVDFTERKIGAHGVRKYYKEDPRYAELMNDPLGEAILDEAGRLTFESTSLAALTQNIPPFLSGEWNIPGDIMSGVKKDFKDGKISYDEYLSRMWDLQKDQWDKAFANSYIPSETGYVERWLIGQSDPINPFKDVKPLNPEYGLQMEDIIFMRAQQIKALTDQGVPLKEASMQIYQEAQNDVGGQMGDLAGQMLGDPADSMGAAQSSIGWGVSKFSGDKIAAQAFADSFLGDKPGYFDAKDRLQNIINNPAEAMKIDPNYKLSELGWLSRAMSGLTKDMKVKAGPFARNTGLFDYTKPKNKLSAFIDAIKYYTPESRIRVGQDLLLRNLGGIMSSYFNGVDVAGFAKWWKAFSNGDMTQAQDLSNAMVQSPEIGTVMQAAKSFDVDGQLAAWQVAEAPRADISRIADALGENPMKLIGSLANGDNGVAVLQERLRTKNNDAAKSVLADIEAGRMDLGVLTEASKGFFDGSIPYSPGQWFANTLKAIKDHYDTWAVDHFNLDAESKKTLFRMSAVLKSAQSILLLGANPGYLIANVLPTMVTRAAAGVFGYMTPDAIDAYMRRMGFDLDEGFAPSRIDEVVGITDIRAEDKIRKAVQGKGRLTNISRVLGKIGQAMPFTALSRLLEGYEGKQAYVIGIKQFMGESWRRGKGFRELPKNLVAELTNVAGSRATDILYSLIEAGMTKDDIENIVNQGSGQVLSRSLINQAANDMNIPAQQAASMLEKLGVLDALDAAMKNARGEAAIRGAFERAKKEAYYALDKQAAIDAIARIEHVANRVSIEGVKAVLDLTLEIEGMGFDSWLRHYERMGKAADEVDFINDADARSAFWSMQYAESAADRQRFNAHKASVHLGLIKAIGLENSPIANSILATISDTEKVIDNAYRTLRDARDGRINTPDVEGLIDKTWKDATKAEIQNSLKLGELLGKQYETLYGIEAGEAARQAWEQITAFRKEMTKKRDAFRESIKGLPAGERRKLSAEFWGKTHRYMIVEMARIKTEAIAKLDRIARGKGGDAQGAQPDPTQPSGGTPTQQSPRNNPLTQEAVDFLRSATQEGAMPAFITNNLRRIASANNIAVTDTMTAADVVKALQEKQNAAPTEPTPPTQPPATPTQIKDFLNKKSDHRAAVRQVINEFGFTNDYSKLKDILTDPKYGGVKDFPGLDDPRLSPELIREILTKHAAVDEMAALRQAAEQRAAAQQAKIDAVWEVAQEYGYSRENTQGMYGLLGALKSEEYGGDPTFTGGLKEAADKWTPDEIDAILEKRRQVKSAEDVSRVAARNLEYQRKMNEAIANTAKRMVTENTPLIEAIRRHGGIDWKYVEQVTGEKKPPINQRSIFSKNGRNRWGLDEMARLLADDGYPIDMNSIEDPGGIQQTVDLIQRAHRGEQIFPMGSTRGEALLDANLARAEADFAESIALEDAFNPDEWMTSMMDAFDNLNSRRMNELSEQVPDELLDQPASLTETYREYIERSTQQVDEQLQAEAERMSIAENKARSEIAVEQQQRLADAAMTREELAQKYVDVFNASQDQVESWMIVNDAVVNTMAKIANVSPEEIYSKFYGDVIRALDVPTSPQVGADRIKGGVDFLDGRAVISAWDGADITTIIHENAHIFRQMMQYVSNKSRNGHLMRDIYELDNWVHTEAERINKKIEAGTALTEYELIVSEGRIIPGMSNGKWQAGHEEIFARAWERYVAEGRVPSATLMNVFQQFSKWITEIYKSITGSAIDVDISPDLRRIFDRLVGVENTRIDIEKIITDLGWDPKKVYMDPNGYIQKRQTIEINIDKQRLAEEVDHVMNATPEKIKEWRERWGNTPKDGEVSFEEKVRAAKEKDLQRTQKSSMADRVRELSQWTNEELKKPAIGDLVDYEGKTLEVGWVTPGGMLRLQDPETKTRVEQVHPSAVSKPQDNPAGIGDSVQWDNYITGETETGVVKGFIGENLDIQKDTGGSVSVPPKKVKKNETQTSMFSAGEDTPIFSQTPQNTDTETYTPTEQIRQETMFDMRPQFGTKEPSLAPNPAFIVDNETGDVGLVVGSNEDGQPRARFSGPLAIAPANWRPANTSDFDRAMRNAGAERKARLNGWKKAAENIPEITPELAERFAENLAELNNEPIKKQEIPNGREKLLMESIVERIKNRNWFAKSRDFETFIKTLGFNIEEEADLNLAYDIMEGAYNMQAREIRARLDENNASLLDRLTSMDDMERNLTEARRTLGKMKLQQFSTPLTLSEAAGWAADVKPGDIVGEPTAGTANLVDLFSQRKDVKVVVNELDPGRRQVLELIGYEPTGMNLMAGDWVINDGKKAGPWANVMISNPPWGSYSTGKYGKPVNTPVKLNDWSQRFTYLEMMRLAEGGRFVGVMPTNWLYTMDRATRAITNKPSDFYKWLKKNFTVQAVIESPPGAYKNRATDISSLLVVIDKTMSLMETQPLEKFGASQPKNWAEYADLLQQVPKRSMEAATNGQKYLTPRMAGPDASGIVDPAAVRGVTSKLEDIGKPVETVSERTVKPRRTAGNRQGIDAGLAEPGIEQPTVQPTDAVGGGIEDTTTVLVDEQPAGIPEPVEQPAYSDAFLARIEQGRAAVKNSGSFTEYLGRAPLGPDNVIHPHPNTVVETKGLAGVPYPDLEEAYKPSPSVMRAMNNRALSYEGNLDPTWAAIQQNDKHGMGMLIADDVGMGKSRTAAAFVLDRIEKGKKRILVVTKDGQNVLNLMNGEFPQVYKGVADENGAFITQPGTDYPAKRIFLSGENFPEVKKGEAAIPTFEEPTVYFVTSSEFVNFEPKLKALDLEVLVVDEAHLFKNVGSTARGQAWQDLHQHLLARKANFLYLTATPGVDLADLQYLYGLRVWSMDGFQDWVKIITGQESIENVKQKQKARENVDAWVEKVQAARKDIDAHYTEVKDRNDNTYEGLKVGRVEMYVSTEYYNKGTYNFVVDGKYLTSRINNEIEAVIIADAVNNRLNELPMERSASDIRDMISDAGNAFIDRFNPPGREEIRAVEMKDASDILQKAEKGKWGKKGLGAFDSTLPPAHTEQIMRELKVAGNYMARDISRAGVEFSVKEYIPPAADKAAFNKRVMLYRRIYEAWAKFGKMNEGAKKAAAMFGINGDIQADAKRALFNMRLPGIIDEAQAAIARGEQVVISVVSVSEVDGETGSLVSALNKINTQKVEKLGKDNFSDPADIPEALIEVMEIKDELQALGTMASPIDILRDVFGDAVAFVTGATSTKDRIQAQKDFQKNRLDVVVISGAGKTGINLHDVTGKKRVHLIMGDYEWSAMTVKQELGRVDRTGQRSSPIVTVMHTGSAGEKKFVATISNRLKGVGAVSKGGADSTGTSALTDAFELGTTMDKIALAAAWQDFPIEWKRAFLDKYFRDQNVPDVPRPMLDTNTEALSKFLLGLQSIEVDTANAIMENYMAKRAELSQMETSADDSASRKTAAMTGEIVRQVELGENLRLTEVKATDGSKYGILDGVLTPHMNNIKGIVTAGADYADRFMNGGNAWMRWVQFYDAAKGEYVTGLQVKPTRIKDVAEHFGKMLGSGHKPETALTDLRAGDRIAVIGSNVAPWELYMGRGGAREGKIVIDGAKMKDRDALMGNGASFSAVGNFFYVTEESLQQFLKRFPIRTEAADKPPTLYQKARPQDGPLFPDADPRMPLGGYEETANWMPLGDAMNEGWRDHVAPLLDKMEDIAVQRMNEPTMKETYRGLSPDGQRMLRNYLAGVQQDLASTKMSALRWGSEKRDNVMLNYNKRTGLDQMLDVVFPYQFFYTRSMMTWAMRAMDNPAWLSNYARIRNQQDRYENNLPERLRGKMRIAAPWMPDWMGDAVYIDPLSVLFTPHNFMRPFEQMMKDENMQTIEAERILQEWAASESVPQEQIVEAAKTRSGDLWDKAMAEAKVRREAEISNPLDFVSATFGPAWYLSTPAKLLGLGKDGPETVTELPITRTARALDTVTNDTWAEPIGNLFGLLAKPEQVFREKNNLPEFGEYGDYYIDRQLANMVAEERITPEEAQIAMIERQGENFEIARERVQLELAMRIPLMGAIYAGLNEGAGAGLQALPASLFGAGVLPQGELEYRGLKDEWNEAWKRRDAGDTEAINRFFEDHPEYEAYLAKGKEPEDRLRSFLIGQIWDGYMSLGETDRKMASAELGDDFRQAFLNKETRSYDVLDVNTLSQWAQLLNKRVPKVEQTMPAIENPLPPIDYFSPEVSAITDKFYEQRRTLYPDYYEVEQGYYDLPKSERRAYLLAHPELKEYWTWKDGWYDRYPELVPVFKGEVFKTVDFSGWNPMLIEYVASYAYAGEDIPAGAYKALEQQWIREGRPRGSVDDWLRIDVAPAMLFGD